MKILPLLRLDRSRMYDGSLTADLQLEGLLSGQALRILRTPCQSPAAIAIADRQAFFARMDDPDFLQRLEEFGSALFRLSKALEVLNESRVEFERLCLRFQAYAAYRTVCHALDGLNGSTPLFDEAAAALLTDEHRALLDRMESDLGQANAILGTLERSIFLLTDSVSFADRAWLLKDNGKPTFRQQFIELAGRMGIRPDEPSPRAVKPDAIIGDAYIQLYADEIDALRTISIRYERLDLSAPLCWLEELAFFREIRELSKKAEGMGIPTCLPAVSAEKRCRIRDAYDITLTRKDCPRIVPNDVDFSPEASFCFLTGANGGGKTTYLRAIGVNLLFFLAGCPIFAENAEIYPFSAIFSHFPEDEDFSGLGRLDTEKLRVDRMLESADDRAFVLFNETFSATDEQKGFSLALSTAEDLRNRGIFGLFVTHFLEVNSQNFPILSAVVEEDGEHRRTFKIVRTGGTNSSYARDILRKYKLDPASLAERREQK